MSREAQGLMPGTTVLLLLLQLLLSGSVREVAGVKREHYIAAVIRDWNYKPGGSPSNEAATEDTTYKKVLYREYEACFTKMKETPEWAGLLGPTLRAEVGDTLTVHFKNMADKDYSIHPQGIAYGKQSEGSLYHDGTSALEKKDDAVPPDGEYTYVWEITEDIGPTEADPPCLTYTYYSHVNLVQDLNSGLVGALLVCKNGSLDENGNQKLFDQEYVLMFAVFDESKSWEKTKSDQQKTVMYSINGYVNGTLPDLTACLYDNISWHFIGVGSEPELFSIHFNGQVLEQNGHKVSTVGLITSSSSTANMTVKYEGKWLLSSFVLDHLEAGMHGYLVVNKCEDKEVTRVKVPTSLRILTQSWKYYIAAEEVLWDYAPDIPKHIDKEFKALYLDRGPYRIGKVYKKAVYREYTNETFTKRKENTKFNETGILGPIIRAQIRDKITIVFKNMASRPYSIYPHGLSISKVYEGANYPPDLTGNRTQVQEVKPGEIFTYEWIVSPEDGPTDKDQRCLTRLYHSSVDVTRDIASGLIGPLLICKIKSLDTRGFQRKADVEQQSVFTMFDENKSWYIEENINTFCTDPSKVDKKNTWFYKSNVMNTINGFVYESIPVMGFCRDNVVFWHISSVGAQDDILTVHFNGHTFEYKKRNEDLLNLFPMSGETVSMEMDNIGEWRFGSLGLQQSNLGMRQKFRDAVCHEETSDEYDDMDQPMTIIRPDPEAENKMKGEKSGSGSSDMPTVQPDEGSEKWAELLGLRALNNSSSLIPNEDLLDLDDLNTAHTGSSVADGVNTAGTEPELEHSSIPEHMDYEPAGSQYSTETGLSEVSEPSFNESDVEFSLNSICALVLGLPGNDDEGNATSEVNTDSAADITHRENSTQLARTDGHTFEHQQKNEDLLNISTGSGETIRMDVERGENIFGSLELQPSNLSMNLKCGDTVCQKGISKEREYSETPVNKQPVDNEKPTDDDEEEEKEEYDDTDLPNDESKTWTVNLGPRTFEHKPDNAIPKEDLLDLTNLNTEDINVLVTDQVNATGDIPIMEHNSNSEPTGSEPTNLEDHMKTVSQEVSDPSFSWLNTDLSLKNVSDLLLVLDSTNNSSNLTLDVNDDYDEDEKNQESEAQQTHISMWRWMRTNENSSDFSNSGFNKTAEHLPRNSASLSHTLLSQANISADNILASYRSIADVSEDSAKANNTEFGEFPANNRSSKQGYTPPDSDVQEIFPEQLQQTISHRGDEKTDELHLMQNSVNSTNNNTFSSSVETGTSLTQCLGTECTLDESVFKTDSYQSDSVNRSLASVNPEDSQKASSSLWDYLPDGPHNVSFVAKSKVQSRSNTTVGSSAADPKDSSLNTSVGFTMTPESMDFLLTNQTNNSRQKYQDTYLTSEEADSYEEAEDVHIYLQNDATGRKMLKVHSKTLDVDKKQWRYLGKEELEEVIDLRHLRKYIGRCKKKSMQAKKMKNSSAPSENSVKFKRKILKDNFSPRSNKPSISIGLPGKMQGEYVEYDVYSQTMKTVQDTSEYSYELVEYENPYTTDSRIGTGSSRNPTSIAEQYLRSSKGSTRTYYIAAEEVYWNYDENRLPGKRNYERIYRKRREGLYKKVVFRSYLDNSFEKSDTRGELEEHHGILGPVIRAEIDDVIMIFFKNLASRPYSIHAHGVSFEKSSEGASYDDGSPDWYKLDDTVLPNKTYVYVWYVKKRSGPEQQEAACKTWAYYSNVNPEKDIHSGLIGPLLICKKGTLHKFSNRPLDAREFVLLFMTFDENRSWYFEENSQTVCKAASENELDSRRCDRFHAINGITYNLQGLMMFDNELVRWHLLNMGGSKDFHVIHFHGQSFTEKHVEEHRLGAFPLLPGTFGTIEMKPSKPGLWLLDTEVGAYQQAGMQSLFLILDPECKQPLGLESGSIRDEQITASHVTSSWEAKLARLNKDGKYNAWSANFDASNGVWIQVDLGRPVIITAIATQGAKQFLTSLYVTEFAVTYSKDEKRWTPYRGNSTMFRMHFESNSNSYGIRRNIFDPPIFARYIRVHPVKYIGRPTLRMELYGCEVDSCSAPLGMESGLINDDQIKASSFKSAWFGYAWEPRLARLNMKGRVNAWQAKANNFQWLQIDLLQIKKITGIITQGATSLRTEMYVKTFALQYSNDGTNWTPYSEGTDHTEKIFKGNSDSQKHVKNYIDPPIFSRLIRIMPKTWNEGITLRMEILGCDIE